MFEVKNEHIFNDGTQYVDIKSFYILVVDVYL